MEQVSQQESVELKGAWGMLRATGTGTVILIVTLVGFVCIGGMIYLHHREQAIAHIALMESADEQTFFLSLPEGEREKYRLKMPGSLWKKLATGGTASPENFLVRP